MIEVEWLACREPGPMLQFLDERVSERKKRLFACACFWQISHLLTDERCLRSGEVAERVADGLASAEELATARADAWEAADALLRTPITIVEPEERCIAWAMRAAIEVLSPVVPHGTVDAVVKAGLDLANRDPELAAETASARTLVHIAHEIFGNPFQSYPAPASWPALVVDLAQQLYDGADVRLVLHDALLDAGHAELAEHFRAEEWHPKGCFAVDLLTGRQ